jgi:DNA polymerase-1
MKPRVYLIDGSALAYRSYFAFIRRPLINSKGENTSAAYGVAATLLKLLREEKPDYMAVVFDSREPTFRHKKFPAYKANREKMPEDMQAQFPRILELVEAMGLRIIDVAGFEADDIMGTLASRFSAQRKEVVLVSADKDFCQLVSESVRLLNPGRAGEEKSWVERNDVVARFGVGPERVVDVLALMGDASDNIPGVPGIGSKTASRLVSRYGGLEEILAKLPIKEEPRASEKLLQFSEQARLSRELASIDLSVPVPIDLEDLRPGERTNERLKCLLEELEFKRLISSIFQTSEPEFAWKTLVSAPDVEELVRKSASWESFGVVLAQRRNRFLPPVGLAVASSDGECFYVDLGEGVAPAGMKQLFSNPEKTAVFHDLKSALGSFSAIHVGLEAKTFDLMLAGYLLDPGQNNSFPALATKYLQSQFETLEAFLGGSRTRICVEEVPPQKLGEYTCRCALAAARLRTPMQSSLAAAELVELYEKVELPLATILYKMEKTGVAVDPMFLRDMSSRLDSQIAEAEREIFRLAGCTFNLNSPAQLSKVLFEDLKLPPVKKTRGTGIQSTDEEVLEELAAQSEVPRQIIRYRQLSKLKNTYVDVFPRMLDASTGRLHPNFNQAVTATGRLSMSEPNLQNIPARTEQGREIRKAFVAGRKGWVLLAADYSQVELRLLAHCSGDEKLILAFREGQDIHASTASSLFGVPEDDVPPGLRARAKVVNFGIIYGMSPYGLSRELGITPAEAKRFIDDYYRLFAGVAQYVRDVTEEARDSGYATTLLGRRRPIPGLRSSNARVRSEAERMAINTPIQGSAADMIKLAMIGIQRKMEERGLEGKLILQIHDELLFELPREETQELEPIVRHEMEHAMELRVPVRVEVGTGENWYDTH